MVISIGGYWLDFEPFDYQEDLDEVFAHYGHASFHLIHGDRQISKLMDAGKAGNRNRRI
jgi:hypothetical protein